MKISVKAITAFMLLTACASQPASGPSAPASASPNANPSPSTSVISLGFETKSCNMATQQETDGPVQTWVNDTTLKIEAKARANCAVLIKTGRYELKGKAIELFYTPGACGVEGAPSCVRCECDHPVSYTLSNLPKGDYTVTLTKEEAK